MTDNTNPEILIVGGGPTGLTLAIECCRHNIPFRIIEQKSAREPYSKALAIWHGTMQMLQAQGLLDEFLQAGMLVERVAFADRGRLLGAIHPQESEFAGFKGPLILAQSETERLLEAKLNALGARLERGVTLTAFTEKEKGIEAKLQHADGTEEVLKVQWLAGCDGARSSVRKTLEQKYGVEFTGYTEPATYLLADVEFEGNYENNQVMVSWGAKSAVALFPVAKQILRVIVERKNGSDLAPTLDEIQASMDQNGPKGLKLKNATWLSLFRINERLSTSYRQGRIFLLGDAAHIHSPAGGQGMNTGMQDAFNLGWKLAYFSRLPRNTMLLSSYEQERRPVAEQVIKEASRKLHFGMMQNPLMRILKDILLPLLTPIKPIRHKIVSELSELFIEYKKSSLIIANNTLPAEQRPGKKWLEAIPSSAFGVQHLLLVFAKTQVEFENFTAEVQACFKDMTVEIVPMLDSEHNAIWYLIRPDQFIAAAGELASLEDLKQYFGNLLL